MTEAFDTRVATIESYFDAYNARDLPAVCATTSPHVEVVMTLPQMKSLRGTAFHGHDGMRTLLHWTFANYPRITVEATVARAIRSSTMVTTTFAIDAQASPEARRDVFNVFDFDRDGIRRMRSFASEREAVAASNEGYRLTVREREVFTLLAAGFTVPQVAQRLVLSPLTVRTHIRNGTMRIQARTRMQAIAMAVASGEVRV
jgi:DNA-binding NarL/FixJ family response regulator